MPKQLNEGDPRRNEFDMKASVICEQSEAVSVNAAGDAGPLVAGEAFVGFTEAFRDNSAGAIGAERVRTKTAPLFELTIVGVTKADFGASVYASGPNTYTLTAGGNSLVGTVHQATGTDRAFVKVEV